MKPLDFASLISLDNSLATYLDESTKPKRMDAFLQTPANSSKDHTSGKLEASQRKAAEIEALERNRTAAINNVLRLRYGIEEFCPEILQFQKEEVARINAFFAPIINMRKATLESMFKWALKKIMF